MFDVDFGKILDSIFDLIPTKSNKNYSIYNGILMDIRDARRKSVTSIDVDKTEIETLKNMLITAALENPTINRKVSFLTEEIEKTLSQPILKPEKPIEN